MSNTLFIWFLKTNFRNLLRLCLRFEFFWFEIFFQKYYWILLFLLRFEERYFPTDYWIIFFSLFSIFRKLIKIFYFFNESVPFLLSNSFILIYSWNLYVDQVFDIFTSFEFLFILKPTFSYQCHLIIFVFKLCE